MENNDIYPNPKPQQNVVEAPVFDEKNSFRSQQLFEIDKKLDKIVALLIILVFWLVLVPIIIVVFVFNSLNSLGNSFGRSTPNPAPTVRTYNQF